MKGKTDRWLKNQYLAYNRQYFHNTLPLDLVVVFRKPDPGDWACTLFVGGLATEIWVDPYLRAASQFALIILLHEMGHVSVGNKEKQYHGPMFRKERQRLIESGAYTTLL